MPSPINLKLVCPCCGRDLWVIASVLGCKAIIDRQSMHRIDIKDAIGTEPAAEDSVARRITRIAW